jgi:hypothetical protein
VLICVVRPTLVDAATTAEGEHDEVEGDEEDGTADGGEAGDVKDPDGDSLLKDAAEVEGEKEEVIIGTAVQES